MRINDLIASPGQNIQRSYWDDDRNISAAITVYSVDGQESRRHFNHQQKSEVLTTESTQSAGIQTNLDEFPSI